MNRRAFAFLTGTLSLFALFTPSVSAQLPQANIVVANRGDGTLSIIDTTIDEVVRTVQIPTANNEAEPMYVVDTPQNLAFWVGDRAQNLVWVFNSRNFLPLGALPAGNGVFHMHTDPGCRTMWLVNEIDRTMTVYDPRVFSILGVVPMPNDLALSGGFPHDVYVENSGNFAYVTIWGLPSGNDAVVKYSTSTLTEVDRVRVGDNPHVAFSRRKLFVPCQTNGYVLTIDSETMTIREEIEVPNPHGATVSDDKNRFYTTNFSGGGVDAIWVIDTRTETVVGGPTDAPSTVPHNLALEGNDRRLYCTHSGANNTVSIYRSSAANPDPVFLKELTVGLNPFGIEFSR